MTDDSLEAGGARSLDRASVTGIRIPGRALAVDVGTRRIGLAVSDATATLARPLLTLTVHTGNGVAEVVEWVERLAAEDEGLAMVVVGRPSRLDGSPNAATAHVAQFVTALRRRLTMPVLEQDERLSSHEAEARLAVTETDWRRRKTRLDAAAAAVFLQDFLDAR